MGEADPRKELSNVYQDTTGTRDENAGVGSSNLSHRTKFRTNLPATNTPRWLAEDMIALAGIMPRHNVLEPSAGTGAIVEHLSWNHAVTAVELNKRNYDRLSAFYGEHVTCLNRDFLLHDFCGVLFDRVVMNPPHKNCVTHIEKAAALLREGGRLVALIHVRYADEISSFLPDVRKYYLPRDTFSLNDEYIESVIIVWDKGDKV